MFNFGLLKKGDNMSKATESASAKISDATTKKPQGRTSSPASKNAEQPKVTTIGKA